MLSAIFLVKDNAAEEFNGAVRVITERNTERFVRAHQKKLQVVCSAYQKKNQNNLSSLPIPIFSPPWCTLRVRNLFEWSRVTAQVCLTRSCFLPILHLWDSSLFLKEKTLNPEIAAMRFEQNSTETVVFISWGVQQFTALWLYPGNPKNNVCCNKNTEVQLHLFVVSLYSIWRFFFVSQLVSVMSALPNNWECKNTRTTSWLHLKASSGDNFTECLKLQCYGYFIILIMGFGRSCELKVSVRLRHCARLYILKLGHSSLCPISVWIRFTCSLKDSLSPNKDHWCYILETLQPTLYQWSIISALYCIIKSGT